MTSKFRMAGIAVLAMVLGLGAASWWSARQAAQVPVITSGTVLPQPRPIADFKLADGDGKAFGLAQLQGGWSLVFAGFLTCPDICPSTLAFLKQLRAELVSKQLNLRVVFLSVDPERDRPDQVKAYVRYFDESFVGLTTLDAQNHEALQGFARNLGLAYQKVPNADGGYTMDHSAALVLINPQGRIAAYFSPPHLLPPIALDLATLMKQP